ncbi:MAG TPA: biotin carboxylase N-terminal domain-containing protein, partial [Caulobacteraceae bacterium]
MPIKHILIANRGEIAIRIARAASELGLGATAVFAAGDGASLHVKAADNTQALPGAGAAGYLDIGALITAAKTAGCDAVHPGYGFLSESAAFAGACKAARLTFIGPSPEVLETLGHKAKARAFAARHGVPVIDGVNGPARQTEIEAFFASLPEGAAMMIKAVAGGGGRGIRIVRQAGEIAAAFASAGREALAAFGDNGLYAERLIERARHIEVQIAGDRTGVLAVGERDCSLQRRHQKIVEIAPAPNLDETVRERLYDAAATIAAAVRYRNLGTIEFLLDVESGDFAFIEANPRLQVEHTITEEVTGLDLVQTQIRLAAGETLAAIGLTATPPPRGVAIQARVNLETLNADGTLTPSGGRLEAYEPPSGPGVRVDGYGWAGYATSPDFDSLIAKVIGSAPDLAQAAAKTARALAEFRIEGVETNISLLRALLARPEVLAGEATTRFIDEHAAELVAAAEALPGWTLAPAAETAPQNHAPVEAPPGTEVIAAGLQATVGAIEVAEGELVRAGQTVAILEAMKMEHVVAAPVAGRIAALAAQKGEVVAKGQALAFIAPEAVDDSDEAPVGEVDLDVIRPDLAEVEARWRLIHDEARPEAVARRRER